jgi:hypothetical protein
MQNHTIPPITKPRPYWHVDAKWIAGILLFLSLSASLLLGALYTMTEEKRAIDTGTIVVASLFSPKGLDAAEDLTSLREKAAASTDKKVAPIPNFPNASVTEEQLNTLSPRELRLAIFRQVVTPIYEKGIVGAAKDFTNDPAQQQQFTKDAQLLQLLTRQTHETLGFFLIIGSIASVVFATAFVYFSWRWGRIGNLGLMLLIVSAVGSAAGLMFLYPPQDGNGGVNSLDPEVAKAIGTSLGTAYFWAVWTGMGLLVAALAGKIVSSTVKRHKK